MAGNRVKISMCMGSSLSGISGISNHKDAKTQSTIEFGVAAAAVCGLTRAFGARVMGCR
jgi:hypothetical protein